MANQPGTQHEAAPGTLICRCQQQAGSKPSLPVKLSLVRFDAVVSSTLLRARETAEILADALRLPLHAPQREFDERHTGAVSDLTSSEIETRFPGLLESRRQGQPIEIPGGVSWSAFRSRVIRSFARLDKTGIRCMLLVTHEGVLRVVASHFNEPQGKYRNLHGRWVNTKSRFW
jgi:broad specificity phosphatase PhoE